MKFYKKIVLFLALFGCSLAYPKTVEHDKKRLIEIIGPIMQNGMDIMTQIDKLSRESSSNIHIFINSPGGSVFTGQMVIDAMTAAKSRGVKFVCSSGVFAASMAFSILAYCDERYALRHTKLLFHPVRAILGGGMFSPGEAVTPAKAKELQEDLEREDAFLKAFVRSCLPKAVEQEWFDHHYLRETLWSGTMLTHEPHMRGWIKIVDDIKGVSSPFNLGE